MPPLAPGPLEGSSLLVLVIDSRSPTRWCRDCWHLLSQAVGTVRGHPQSIIHYPLSNRVTSQWPLEELPSHTGVCWQTDDCHFNCTLLLPWPSRVHHLAHYIRACSCFTNLHRTLHHWRLPASLLHSRSVFPGRTHSITCSSPLFWYEPLGVVIEL